LKLFGIREQAKLLAGITRNQSTGLRPWSTLNSDLPHPARKD